MKRIFILLTLKLLYTISLSAQIYNDESENNKYFNDLGISYSTLIFHGDASTVNLSGAHYFSRNLGVRTGLSFTRDITDDCDWMIKVPALFSLRSETIDGIDPDFDTCESVAEYLVTALVSLLPKRFEVNIGPSFGYMSTNNEYSEKDKYRSGNYFINTKPMVTMDLNGKMIIPMGRVGLDISLGVSYFLTRNVKHYSSDDLDNKISRWMGNFTVGGHYRF